MWFMGKLVLFIFLFIWLRGTLPRLRVDQLMNFAWKFMLPLALINLVNAGLWHYLPTGWLRWPVSAALVVVPYVWLGRGLMRARGVRRRVYRYAT